MKHYIKPLYVVACYDESHTNKPCTPQFIRDGHRKPCFLPALPNGTIPLYESRDKARSNKFPCDRVWLVLYNHKLGRIQQWLKKNP